MQLLERLITIRRTDPCLERRAIDRHDQQVLAPPGRQRRCKTRSKAIGRDEQPERSPAKPALELVDEAIEFGGSDRGRPILALDDEILAFLGPKRIGRLIAHDQVEFLVDAVVPRRDHEARHLAQQQLEQVFEQATLAVAVRLGVGPRPQLAQARGGRTGVDRSPSLPSPKAPNAWPDPLSNSTGSLPSATAQIAPE